MIVTIILSMYENPEGMTYAGVLKGKNNLRHLMPAGYSLIRDIRVEKTLCSFVSACPRSLGVV